LESELIDLPHNGRNRSHLDINALGDALLGFGQSLEDKLAGKVDVDIIIKDDGDERKTELRDGAQLLYLWKPAHRHFNGVGHRSLDLQG